MLKFLSKSQNCLMVLVFLLSLLGLLISIAHNLNEKNNEILKECLADGKKRYECVSYLN